MAVGEHFQVRVDSLIACCHPVLVSVAQFNCLVQFNQMLFTPVASLFLQPC